jgi:hypothetical protein
MVFNAAFDNISAISWRLVLLVEETEVTSRLVLSFLKTLSCFEVFWIRLSICFVHLQSLLIIMPKCLCLLTELRTIPSKSKLSSSCWFLILNIIISVLLGLNFTNQVSPHFFILFRSILIQFYFTFCRAHIASVPKKYVIPQCGFKWQTILILRSGLLLYNYVNIQRSGCHDRSQCWLLITSLIPLTWVRVQMLIY